MPRITICLVGINSLIGYSNFDKNTLSAIKRARKIALGLIIALITIFLMVAIAVNIPQVQRKLGQYAADYLSKELKVPVQVDNLRVQFFSTLALEGVYIADEAGDTLIFVGELGLDIKHTGIFSGKPQIDGISLIGLNFNYRETGKTTTNLDFLLDYFAGSPEPAAIDTNTYPRGEPLLISELFLEDCRFSYQTFQVGNYDGLINFDSLTVYDLSGQIFDLALFDDSVSAYIDNLSLVETSGFEIQKLHGQFAMSGTQLKLDELLLRTNTSLLQGAVALNQESWASWNNMYADIHWKAQFDSSKINLADLRYFTSGFEDAKLDLYIDGGLRGSIDDLRSRDLTLRAGNRSVVKASASIQGLPNMGSSFIDGQIKQLSTDYRDIELIRSQLNFDGSEGIIPKEMARAGNLFFSGSFTGFPSDFVAYGSLISEIGTLDLDINFERDTFNTIRYSGGFSAKQFGVGRLLDIPELGKVTAKTSIKAETRNGLTEAQLDGNVAQLVYRGYGYTDLAVNGKIIKKGYSGSLVSKDPNFNLIFDGLLDFSSEIPIVDFQADIFNLNLSKLNLLETSREIAISTKLNLNGQGRGIDDINGTADAADTYFCIGDSVVFIDQMEVFAAGNQQNRRISFESSILDATVTGAFSLETLGESFLAMGHAILPTYFDSIPNYTGNNLAFNLAYKEPNEITAFFLPGLRIAANTTAYGSLNSFSNTASLAIQSPMLAYRDVELEGVRVDMGYLESSLAFKVNSDSASYSGVHFDHLDFRLRAKNDSLNLITDWYNTNGSFSGDLGLEATFETADTINLLLGKLNLTTYDNSWTLKDTAKVRLGQEYYDVSDFNLRSGIQGLFIDGLLSRSRSEELNLALSNIDVAALSGIPGLLPVEMEGTLNLTASLQDFYQNRLFRGSGRLDSLKYGNQEVGDIVISAIFDPASNQVDLDAEWFNRGQRIFDFVGAYALKSENPLYGKILLKDFDLAFINELDVPEVSQFSGFANGEIKVEGKLAEPALEGFISLDKARFKVDYLNAYFTFSDKIRVENDFLGIDYKPIYDDRGHKGFIVASAFHTNYANWNYDFRAEVNNFLLVNTDRSLNDTYYGTAYATGELQMSGYGDLLQITIDAITEDGTSIKLPLDGNSEQTLENFVYFVNKNASDSLERKANLLGVELLLNIEATPDAEIQLIFDQQTGEIIRGSGNGILTLEITPAGEFLMFGRYLIEEGDYLFTLKSLINKEFEIRTGSSIAWYGDPYQADIDISAVYQLRAPLYPIMVENQDRYRGREDINVVLELKNKLLTPDIRFGIELPQATATERNQLESVVSTTQQLNQQVFSLLILNRFLPSSQNEGTGSGAGVQNFGAATTSDFVSTQISSWLSEISDQFDIGVNYRPGDQISNQEVALALSTQLFNERLAVSGSFGVTSATETQYTQGQSGILGDFKVEYSLTEEGKIRLKVFNETNPYEVFSTSTSLYTQGAGLVYQEDFDTLDEFFAEIGQLFKKDKANRVEETP